MYFSPLCSGIIVSWHFIVWVEDGNCVSLQNVSTHLLDTTVSEVIIQKFGLWALTAVTAMKIFLYIRPCWRWGLKSMQLIALRYSIHLDIYHSSPLSTSHYKSEHSVTSWPSCIQSFLDTYQAPTIRDGKNKQVPNDGLGKRMSYIDEQLQGTSQYFAHNEGSWTHANMELLNSYCARCILQAMFMFCWT